MTTEQSAAMLFAMAVVAHTTERYCDTHPNCGATVRTELDLHNG